MSENHETEEQREAAAAFEPPSWVEDICESLVFNSRLLLIPMYVMLAAGMLAYDVSFAVEWWETCQNFWAAKSQILMMGFIGLVDTTMVANLIVMTTIGGLSIFVREIDVTKRRGLPRWMNKLTSGMLKVKMSSSLVSITAVHLLQDVEDIANSSWNNLAKRIVVHVVFVLSAYVFARIEVMTHPPHQPHTTTYEKPTSPSPTEPVTSAGLSPQV